jgi:hypothetical protein
MNCKRIFVTVIPVFLFFNLAARDIPDDTGFCKNEIGIDVANIITVLSKKPESFLLNYKRHLTEKNAVRCGFDIEWSTSDDGYKGLRNKIGYERNRAVMRNWKWQFSYGTDVSFLYRANNFQSNKTVKGGIHPFIGFAHYFVKQFSIATELNLNFFVSKKIKPNSYDANENKTVFDMSIGSVGMLLICYHF